ncbi:MAG: hypothetical protein KGY70_19875 [Bacteroidales bacterium]|nr:hypothetical protein [Bacteroidales bacterium]MBS3777464.1 hypothetical protein [Bacteroidales bacterium]
MKTKFSQMFYSGHIPASWYIVAVTVFLLAGCQAGWDIENPYEQVDWSNHKQYKANLHSHTTRSDGWMGPQTVVDRYHQLGYHILAITDHNEVTWPWTGFADMEPSETAKEVVEDRELDPEKLVYENRGPSQLGMLDVQGNELSQHHHMGSYFTDHNGTSAVEKSLSATASKNGLVLFNHPGRYTTRNPDKFNPGWYEQHFQGYEHLLGIEVYNQGDRYPEDRRLWDSILTRMMPERSVWGFSNDDMHSEGALGRNWNVFILPELSEEGLREGMKDGRFYYVYAPEGHDGPNPPRIEKIDVNERQGEIEIQTLEHDSIRWISGGEVLQTGNSLRLNDHPGISGYVRAEIFGPGKTITGTQPFGIDKRE